MGYDTPPNADIPEIGREPVPQKMSIARWLCICVFFLAVSSLAINIYDKYFQTPKPPASLEEAVQRMVGTWTFTEPVNINEDRFPFEWMRWTIRADGSVTECYASPKDDAWSRCEEHKARFLTDKYADTGKRWYGLRRDAMTGVYEPEKDTIDVRVLGMDGIGSMTRGDKNPFSK